MPVNKNFRHSTGKENLIASFNNFLIENVQGGHVGIPPLPADKNFFWAFNFPIQPQNTPAISTAELGLFNLGAMGFDRLIGVRSSGEPVRGQKNQTLIEITCHAKDSATVTNAIQTVYNLRDRVIQALNVDTIELRDYANHPSNPPKLGVITVDDDSNAINETLIVDPQDQEFKRYVLRLRVFWCEVDPLPKTQNITSDAEIT